MYVWLLLLPVVSLAEKFSSLLAKLNDKEAGGRRKWREYGGKWLKEKFYFLPTD